MTAFLTEPTSVKVAPSFNDDEISFAISPITPTGVEMITKSAPSTASAALSQISSMIFNSNAFFLVLLVLACPEIVAQRPCFFKP